MPAFEVAFTAPAGMTWVRAEVVEPDAQAERETLDGTCDQAALIGESGFPESTSTTYCRNQLLVLAFSSALYLGRTAD
jgi:hypothetical protein